MCNMTSVKILPICNCGYIFKDGLYARNNIVELNGIKYSEPYIDPPYCPNCNRKIACIEWVDYIDKRLKE